MPIVYKRPSRWTVIWGMSVKIRSALCLLLALGGCVVEQKNIPEGESKAMVLAILTFVLNNEGQCHRLTNHENEWAADAAKEGRAAGTDQQLTEKFLNELNSRSGDDVCNSRTENAGVRLIKGSVASWDAVFGTK